MSNSAIDEYTEMRDAIQSNIDAIKRLIDQADNLSQTINTIKDDDTKKALEDNVRSLNDSIDNLVAETNKLFKRYIDLANSVVIV